MIVKICGITSVDDALACLAAGVDWIGLNFVPSSRRRIDVATAKAIASAVGGKMELVGVTADLTREELEALRGEARLDRLQLHGDEPPALVEALGPRAFKAVRVGEPADVEGARAYPGSVLLVDAKVGAALGGTGHRVDDGLARALAAERPILLAGGLRPENVRAAILEVGPFGVDTASGVEPPGRAGVKDHDAIARFVAEARAAAGARTSTPSPRQ